MSDVSSYMLQTIRRYILNSLRASPAAGLTTYDVISCFALLQLLFIYVSVFNTKSVFNLIQILQLYYRIVLLLLCDCLCRQMQIMMYELSILSESNNYHFLTNIHYLQNHLIDVGWYEDTNPQKLSPPRLEGWGSRCTIEPRLKTRVSCWCPWAPVTSSPRRVIVHSSWAIEKIKHRSTDWIENYFQFSHDSSRRYLRNMTTN